MPPYNAVWYNSSTGAFVLTAVAIDSAGLTATSSISVTVPYVNPAITVQPTNLIVMPGSNATFSVTAGGTAPLSYQWYFDTTNPLTGANSAALPVTNMQPINVGNY